MRAANCPSYASTSMSACQSIVGQVQTSGGALATASDAQARRSKPPPANKTSSGGPASPPLHQSAVACRQPDRYLHASKEQVHASVMDHPHAPQRGGMETCAHRIYPCHRWRMVGTSERRCHCCLAFTHSSFWCWACCMPRKAPAGVTERVRGGRAQIRAAIGTTRASPACCQAMSTLLKNVRSFTCRCVAPHQEPHSACVA